MSKVINVAPRQLRAAKSATLRSEVVKDSLAYQELVHSLQHVGFLNSISASPALNEDGTPETNSHGEEMFEITDGFHRWTAATDLGMTEIPLLVMSKGDLDLLALQIAANSIKIETKRAEYAQALKQMIQNGKTLNEVCALTDKSATWVQQQLALTKLPESVQKMINDGTINAMNAVQLAKLPANAVEEFVPGAQVDPMVTFQQKVEAFMKARREAIKAGRSQDNSFKPSPLPRKSAELKNLYEDFSKKGFSETINQLVVGVNDPVVAATKMLEWVIQLDPTSVANQKAMWEADEAKKAAAKAKKEAEKEAKKNEMPVTTTAA
jgi:ParB/RepB/Spo0J family partition protein